MKSPKVSVIIPTYNRRKNLMECIDSVLKNDMKDIEVIVVNDYPKDDLSDLRRRYPKIRLIQNMKEIYLADCRNEGAKAARGEFLYFVDDDNILRRDTISALLDGFDSDRRIGLLGPLMYNAKGDLWFSGFKVDLSRTNIPKRLSPGQGNALIETDFVPNSCMVRKAVYMSVGGSNGKAYVFQHEDLDLALRLRRKGYRHYVYTGSSLVHNYEASGNLSGRVTPRRLLFALRGNVVLEYEYAPLPKLLSYFCLFMPVHFLYYMFVFIPRSPYSKIAMYKAYFSGLMTGFHDRKLVKRDPIDLSD